MILSIHGVLGTPRGDACIRRYRWDRFCRSPAGSRLSQYPYTAALTYLATPWRFAALDNFSGLGRSLFVFHRSLPLPVLGIGNVRGIDGVGRIGGGDNAVGQPPPNGRRAASGGMTSDSSHSCISIRIG
jgi:hypothetical protein